MKAYALQAADAGDSDARWSPPFASAVRRDVEPNDYCSREGAMALKAKIEAYWRERGHDVMLSLHNVGFHPAIRAARFDVRSDMVNGMPRAGAAAPKPQAASGPKLVEDGDEDDYLDLED